MNQEVQEVKNLNKKSYASVPLKPKKPANTPEPQVCPQPVENNLADGIQPLSQTVNFPMKMNSNIAIEKICSAFSDMEISLREKMSQLLEEKLDEKLDGMDEVVVELVRCKTENETLRYKMNELNKEVYNLKNELSK